MTTIETEDYADHGEMLHNVTIDGTPAGTAMLPEGVAAIVSDHLRSLSGKTVPESLGTLTREQAHARMAAAIDALGWGGTDGAHHKQWVIDQALRALTGCPMETIESTDAYGKPYSYLAQGESDEYRTWVAQFEDGDDGPETYEWDTGIAP